MEYVCLPTQKFSHEPYHLVPLRYKDIFDIKQWRNEQISILRQEELLTDTMQDSYYQKTIYPSFSMKKPKQILFSYLIEDECIGYGGIVHIDWPSQRGELSFLVASDRARDPVKYRQDFSVFLQLIKNIAFNVLQFHRLFAETFDCRPLHVAILEEQEFELEGRLRDHVLINRKFIDSLIHGCVNFKPPSK